METALIPYAALTYSMLKLKMLLDMALMSIRLTSSSDRDSQNVLMKEVSLSLIWHTDKLCGCWKRMTMKRRKTAKMILKMKPPTVIGHLMMKRTLRSLKEILLTLLKRKISLPAIESHNPSSFQRC